MNYLVEEHDGVIMFIVLKDGKMKSVHALTPLEARMIGNKLVETAESLDGLTRTRL